MHCLNCDMDVFSVATAQCDGKEPIMGAFNRSQAQARFSQRDREGSREEKKSIEETIQQNKYAACPAEFMKCRKTGGELLFSPVSCRIPASPLINATPQLPLPFINLSFYEIIYHCISFTARLRAGGAPRIQLRNDLAKEGWKCVLC